MAMRAERVRGGGPGSLPCACGRNASAITSSIGLTVHGTQREMALRARLLVRGESVTTAAWAIVAVAVAARPRRSMQARAVDRLWPRWEDVGQAHRVLVSSPTTVLEVKQHVRRMV